MCEDGECVEVGGECEDWGRASWLRLLTPSMGGGLGRETEVRGHAEVKGHVEVKRSRSF